MAACEWETVEAFKSLADYKMFSAHLEGAVAAGKARLVPVDPARGWGTAWKERWFQCLEDNVLWRLVAPDGPFPGVFDRL